MCTFRGDKSEHSDLADRVGAQVSAEKAKHLVIAVPNYRIGQHPDHPGRADVKHPTHALDCMRSILWLSDSKNVAKYTQSNRQEGLNHDIERQVDSVYIAGHSCGAHILSNILFLLPGVPAYHIAMTLQWPPPPLPPPSPTSASIDEKEQLLKLVQTKIKGLAFLDGILNLVDLIDEYPAYKGFTESAFGEPGPDNQRWIQPSIPLLRTQDLPEQVLELLGDQSRSGPKLIVAHATEDELLSPRQDTEWFKWLEQTFGSSSKLLYDDTTLQGSHHGCLQHDGVGKLLANLVQ